MKRKLPRLVTAEIMLKVRRVAGRRSTGEDVCRTCHGTGRIDTKTCPTCGGTGKVIEGIGGG